MTKVRSTARREHGGDIDVARQRHGRADMIDLSTGISPSSYPAPPLTADRLQALPMQSDLAACLAAARRHYQVPDELALCAGPGTQALLQLVPALAEEGAADDARQPPAWLWSIVFLELALFSSFGAVSVLEWRGTLGLAAAEKTYIGLSLVSKSLLVGLATGGLLAPTDTAD